MTRSTNPDSAAEWNCNRVQTAEDPYSCTYCVQYADKEAGGADSDPAKNVILLLRTGRPLNRVQIEEICRKLDLP